MTDQMPPAMATITGPSVSMPSDHVRGAHDVHLKEAGGLTTELNIEEMYKQMDGSSTPIRVGPKAEVFAIDAADTPARSSSDMEMSEAERDARTQRDSLKIDELMSELHKLEAKRDRRNKRQQEEPSGSQDSKPDSPKRAAPKQKINSPLPPRIQGAPMPSPPSGPGSGRSVKSNGSSESTGQATPGREQSKKRKALEKADPAAVGISMLLAAPRCPSH